LSLGCKHFPRETRSQVKWASKSKDIESCNILWKNLDSCQSLTTNLEFRTKLHSKDLFFCWVSCMLCFI
jgi:hypothetical protein